MTDRENLESAFKLEPKLLGHIERNYELVASCDRFTKKIQATVEHMQFQTEDRLLRVQTSRLLTTYMMLIAQAQTEEERLRLVMDYEHKVAELRKHLLD